MADPLALHKTSAAEIFFRQLKNPLLIILMIAAAVSFLAGENRDGTAVIIMVVASVLIGFSNEFQAEKIVADLLKRVSLKAIILRHGEKVEINASALILKEEVYLTTGAIVPADILVSETNHLRVDESMFTGESLPVEKKVGDLAYLGSVVVSGFGTGTVFKTGKETKFGLTAIELSKLKSESSFTKNLSRFSMMLARIIVLMAIGVFVGNFLLGRPIFTSLLFSLAIAVGLTPEFLPVVVTVSMAFGAKKLSGKHLIVKRLAAIEDLGNLDYLCTDKTGTLTEGKISLEPVADPEVLKYALLANQAVVHHKIIGDTIDTAIWEYAQKNNFDESILKAYHKDFVYPFDYDLRITYATVTKGRNFEVVVKGSIHEVLGRCHLSPEKRANLLAEYVKMAKDGKRLVAVAKKRILKSQIKIEPGELKNLDFVGILAFADLPKSTAMTTIAELKRLGVRLVIITGDNEDVARSVAIRVGIKNPRIVSASGLDNYSLEELEIAALNTDIFTRTTPSDKEKIIRAIQRGKHTVGFLGDGVNDALALKAADVGVAVDQSSDIAKDAAAIVLLRKDLSVIIDGIKTGREIFQNTIKYLLMETGSNFGNMFSAAGASFLLPFFPATPSQILLGNALYDVSQLTLPTDNVDRETLAKPRDFDLNMLKKFMMVFGPISSVFDFITFGVLLYIFRASAQTFQAGWFLESMTTQLLVVFLVRTARPFFASVPSKPLIMVVLGAVLVSVLVVTTPLSSFFGLIILPLKITISMLIITMLYLLVVESVKSRVLKGV